MTLMGTMKVKPVQASSWTPASLPTLTAWYDASDTATITASANQVSQWNDKSANAYNLTQATGAFQALTATDTINSLNVLKFDGTNDCLNNASLTGNAATRTIIAVVKPTANVKSNFIGPNGGTGGLNCYVTGSGGNQTQGMDKSFVHAYSSATSTFSTSTVHVVEYEFVNTTSQKYWLDGAADGSFTDATALGTGATTQIGGNDGGEFFNGDIAEIIISDAILSTADRQSAESYLKAKWGTP